MKLSDLIHDESVIADLEATDRNGVIRELVQSLADHGAILPECAETIAKKVISRERKGTTGFGRGVAVPHEKIEGVEKMTATIGRSSRGVDFAALDRGPVYGVILLVSPKNASEDHVAAMEKIFQCVKQEKFRRFLRQASTHEEIVDLIKEADELQDD